MANIKEMAFATMETTTQDVIGMVVTAVSTLAQNHQVLRSKYIHAVKADGIAKTILPVQ